MLLNTQAQLLHPLQLGLDSSTVSLQQPSTESRAWDQLTQNTCAMLSSKDNAARDIEDTEDNGDTWLAAA